MGTITLLGAIIIIIAWITLIEFDSYPEAERSQIIKKIKKSSAYISLIAIMPIGILVNVLGRLLGSVWMISIGASLIVLQGIIISVLLWNKRRWKSILLLATIIPLGAFIYIPLFIR